MNRRARVSGLTIVELLVVIGIVGVLTALLLPAVQAVREAGRRTTCANKVRQLALAIQNFESAKRSFPSGINHFDANVTSLPSITWLAQLLPYVEQRNRWNSALTDFNNFDSPFNHANFQSPVELYACPSDSRTSEPHFTHDNRLAALTSYVGVNGTNHTLEDGVFYRESQTRFADIEDGSSQTLLIGERPPSVDFWYGWWYAGFGFNGSGSPDMLLGVRELNHYPDSRTTFLESCAEGPFQYENGKGSQCDTLHFWSYHPSGSNFALCDGSVHFLNYSANDLLPKLATRKGGEVIDF